MNIKATIIEHQQGSEGWMQHRARSLNASDLAAAMGLSPYLSRSDLIKRIATGIVPEVDAATQRRFDRGHEVEALARPLAEEIVGEDLYCSTFAAEVDGLLLSASLDGHTVMQDRNWEHKQENSGLIASLLAGVIPEQYHPQMEQGQMLTGATRTLFTASNGTRESAVHVWYESNPELRAKIMPTWKQFMADVAAYVPTATEVKPTGKAPETLPALHIVIQGGVSASNLDEFKETALGAIRSVNRELTTDVHFADAEKAVKWCCDIEDRIKAAKDHALSQTASIDALFRTMDEISAEARRVRLDLDKLVKARKESMKADIVASGVAAMAKHIRELNASMPANYMPVVPADFGGAIKGLRTIDSITNAVDTELSRVKIAANDIANRIHANVKTLQESGLVVHDTAALVLKQPDDLAAVIAQRVAAEKAKEEAQRERIRAEEAARLEREAKAEADRLERERAIEEAKRIERENDHEAAMRTSLVPMTGLTSIPEVGLQIVTTLPRHPVIQPTESLRQYGEAEEITEHEDNGARLTLGQLNDRLAPVSINVAGLSSLGFDPVEQVKASRFYRECDLHAICQAISRHLETVSEHATA